MSEIARLWSYIIPIILAAGVGALNLWDMNSAPPHKRPLRLMGAVIDYYFVLIWITAITGIESYWLLSGFVTRIGVVLLISKGALDILISRRGANNANRDY